MTTSTGEPDERASVAGAQGQARQDIPADTFALRLAIARHHAGRLSIEQAAKACGLNSGNWQRWEDGALPRDKVETAQHISDGLGIDFNWLLLGGPLTGPRGLPTGRQSITRRYPLPAVWTVRTRPNGRTRTGSPPSGPRRAIRVNTSTAI